ncbi:MAG: PQQ-binding-like beta-propeller repeat protein [Haloarculaceae archaeon]
MTTRRRLLAAAGTGIGAALAGCASTLGRIDRDPFDPDAPTELDEFAATQFRLDLRNTGYVDATIPERVEVDWSMPVNRGEHTAAKSTPVAVDGDGTGEGDGDVLIAGDTGKLRRVRPDGTVRWTAAVEPVPRGIHGTPAVANGSAYVGAYDGALYAFDLATGERRWRTSIGDAIGSSPVYYNGIVYIAVEYAEPSGSVAALDAATGEAHWVDGRPTDHPHSTIALDREAGRLVVGSNDGVCYAWSFPDLDRAWTFETGGAIKGPVAARDGLAVFGSWDGRVYTVDVAGGSEVWSFAADGDVMSGAAITPDGTVYVGSHDSNLYALDLADGRERWRFDTGGLIIGSVTATREHVLAGSYDTRMYALDAATGEETWYASGRGHATSAVLVTDGALYYAERSPGDRPGLCYRLVAR